MEDHVSLRKLKTSRKLIAKGVYFHEETVSLSDDRYTNLYWVSLEKKAFHFDLSFSRNLLPLIDFEKGNKHVVSGINFGGFLLVDEDTNLQTNNYNLAVDHGHILQLPSNQRTALYTRLGKISKILTPANGTVSIGENRFIWSGSQDNTVRAELKVFGVFDLDIINDNSKELGHRRLIDNKTRYVHAKKDAVLIGVTEDNGVQRVSVMIKKKLELTNYLYLFVAKDSIARQMKLGDEVTNLEFENKKLGNNENACSACFELGTSKDELTRNLFNELLLPNDRSPKPLNEDYKKSWSILLDIGEQYIFLINDARPNIHEQQGATILELQKILKEKFSYKWAVVGDSGQSSKIFIRENGKRKVYGNLHYINYKSAQSPYWDGKNGRRVSVALLAYD